MAKKKTPRRSKKKKPNYVIPILVILIVIAAIYLVINRSGIILDGGIAATVNGEIITVRELNQKYGGLSDQYKLIITKELLLEQMINTKLLVNEAEDKEIEVDDGEIEAGLDDIKGDLFESDEDFMEFLKENNLELDEVKEQLKEKLMIDKLLEQEILSKIEISESKIKAFYESNKDLLEDVSYEEIKDDIEQSLAEDLAGGSIQTYIAQLRSKAEIIIDGTRIGAKEDEDVGEESLEEVEDIVEEEKILTFEDTGDDICTENGKPIIRFYITSKCTPCNWVKSDFYSAVNDYEENVVVYHWELDTGDNMATGEKEKGIPKEEVEIFKKYNDKSTVPTYVFGCKYVRIGNGHEDLEEEQKEFKAVINALLE